MKQSFFIAGSLLALLLYAKGEGEWKVLIEACRISVRSSRAVFNANSGFQAKRRSFAKSYPDEFKVLRERFFHYIVSKEDYSHLRATNFDLAFHHRLQKIEKMGEALQKESIVNKDSVEALSKRLEEIALALLQLEEDSKVLVDAFDKKSIDVDQLSGNILVYTENIKKIFEAVQSNPNLDSPEKKKEEAMRRLLVLADSTVMGLGAEVIVASHYSGVQTLSHVEKDIFSKGSDAEYNVDKEIDIVVGGSQEGAPRHLIEVKFNSHLPDPEKVIEYGINYKRIAPGELSLNEVSEAQMEAWTKVVDTYLQVARKRVLPDGKKKAQDRVTLFLWHEISNQEYIQFLKEKGVEVQFLIPKD